MAQHKVLERAESGEVKEAARLYSEGKFHAALGHFDTAISHFSEAASLAREARNVPLLERSLFEAARAMVGLGNECAHNHDLETAEKHYSKATKLLDECNRIGTTFQLQAAVLSFFLKGFVGEPPPADVDAGAFSFFLQLRGKSFEVTTDNARTLMSALFHLTGDHGSRGAMIGGYATASEMFEDVANSSTKKKSERAFAFLGKAIAEAQLGKYSGKWGRAAHFRASNSAFSRVYKFSPELMKSLGEESARRSWFEKDPEKLENRAIACVAVGKYELAWKLFEKASKIWLKLGAEELKKRDYVSVFKSANRACIFFERCVPEHEDAVLKNCMKFIETAPFLSTKIDAAISLLRLNIIQDFTYNFAINLLNSENLNHMTVMDRLEKTGVSFEAYPLFILYLADAHGEASRAMSALIDGAPLSIPFLINALEFSKHSDVRARCRRALLTIRDSGIYLPVQKEAIEEVLDYDWERGGGRK